MTGVLSAVFAAILRVGLQVFDRKILNKNPNFFSEIMQRNSSYLFVFALLFILVLGQRQTMFEYLLSWETILQGIVLASASWSISLGLKNMNLRYVVVVQKLVDLLIPFILVASYTALNLVGVVTIFFYIPFLYSGIKFKNICFLSVFCIIATISLQAFLASLAAKERPDSIMQFCSYVTAILFWRWMVTVSGRFFLLFKSKNNLDNVLKAQLVARAGFAYLSQIFFFFAITSENAAQSWVILNASPVFSMCAASLFLGEKLLPAELVSVFFLIVGVAICCIYCP